MSLTRIACITINKKIDIELIRTIVLNALRKGFYFFDNTSHNLQPLSFETAVDRLLNPTPEVLYDGGPYLETILNDGRFSFKIAEYDNQTYIMLDPLLELWVKKIDADTILDFGRYAYTLLEITEPYEVLSITLETF